jgi:hypothetical protein
MGSANERAFTLIVSPRAKLHAPSRFFRGFTKSHPPRVATAWCLAGARLFGSWMRDEEATRRIVRRLVAKGYRVELVDVGLVSDGEVRS